MARKNNRWIWLGIIAAVIIISLVVMRKKGWIGPDESLKVTTETVSKRDIIEIVSASGKVQPEIELKITADVSGEITELYVAEGDVVKKGTLLCRINPEVYASNFDRTEAALNTARANARNSQSRLAQAEAQFNQAKLSFDRNKKLFEDKVISPAEFDNIRSSFEVASAEVEAARQSVAAANFSVRSAEAGVKESRENLNRTSIYAPVAGTVSKLSKEKGERVVGTNMMEGTEIMRLANLNEMEVSVDVSETDIMRVSEGDTAEIEVDAWLGRFFQGVVTEVANSSTLSANVSATDQVTNYAVKVRILKDSYSDLLKDKPADYSPFRPGMSATVDIHTRKKSAVRTVPIQSVTTRDTVKRDGESENNKNEASAEPEESKSPVKEGEGVFVFSDGKALWKKVETGIQDSKYIEIISGLNDGDVVVSGPYNAVSKQLKNGMAVQVVSREELFESAVKAK